MSARTDLLELTPEALVALSNQGFVKRALKDVAEGKLPAIEQLADGAVMARYGDGAVTSLAPGKPLRDALCSCPAAGLCRHRVTLVLAYQAQHAPATPAAGEAVVEAASWCPSQLAGAVDALPRATLDQARRIAAGHPVVRISAGATPGARLPMCDVRFYSRTSLALARCDCAQSVNCAHVAVAVWAFAQGRRQQSGFDVATVVLELPSAGSSAPSEIAPLDAAPVLALARQLWLDGTSQPLLALERRFEQALHHANQQRWSWVAEALAQLHGSVSGQHRRSSNADPLRLLHLVCALVARLLAAGHASAMPPRQILGTGVAGEVVLDHVRLVPLGAQCWRDDSVEGTRLIWADPDTLAVTVLEKSWALPPDGAAATPMRERRVAGAPLHRLAASQVVTRAAKRRANGALTIGATAAQSAILPCGASAWDGLASPLRQPSVAALRAHLDTLAPDFARALQAIEHVHVLPVTALLWCAWDAASQTLSAAVQVGEDEADVLQVHSRHDIAAPYATDALASALARAVALAGTVERRGGQLYITPLALFTAEGLLVPALAGAAAPMALAPASIAQSDPLRMLLDQTHALLAQTLRQGVRHQRPAALARLAEQAARLRRAGLARCADALEAAFSTRDDCGAAGLEVRLAALHALLVSVGEARQAAP